MYIYTHTFTYIYILACGKYINVGMCREDGQSQKPEDYCMVGKKV